MSIASSFWRGTRARLFALRADEASFARRGFRPGRAESQRRLEVIGRTFIHGYNAVVRGSSPVASEAELERCPLELRGFAYEGAAMACALLDRVLPIRAGRWHACDARSRGRSTATTRPSAGWWRTATASTRATSRRRAS